MQTLITRLLFSMILLFSATSTFTQNVFGLTEDSEITTFTADAPSFFTNVVTITGLNTGQKIIGIDVRPATGELYGLGYNAIIDSASLYVINPMTGVAIAKGSFIKLSGLGSVVGFDFNPTVDRIRLVSKSGKNYRLNPNNGAIAATDLSLNYAVTDSNAGKTPNATACAYTNSYIAATSTQLFTYDEAIETLTFQNPPNDGILNTKTKISSPISGTVFLDFDIYTNPSTFMNVAYATGKSGTGSTLFSFNTTTGVMTPVGNFSKNIIDIAISIDRKIPEMKGSLAYGLTFSAGNTAFNLLSFDTKKPSFIRSAKVIGGIKKNQILLGMDVRPQDNKLYVLGYRAVDSVATIYTLNDTSAMLSIHPGADSFKLALVGATAFDFNPAANRLRIISSNNRANYRLNLTANPITVTLDTMITYKSTDVNSGKTPIVVSGAYTKSFNGTTATQLYDIDAALNSFVNQKTANGGFLNTIGALGITLDPNDYTVDMDIQTPSSTAADTAYLAANVQGSAGFDNLYTLNIVTGQTTLVDRIGYGIAIRNIAIKSLPKTTSIKDIIPQLKTLVFPNPVSDKIQVQFKNSTNSPVAISLYNLQGQLILQKNYTEHFVEFDETLDLSIMNSGCYILKINTLDNSSIVKIIKE